MQQKNQQQENHLPEITRLLSMYHALSLPQLGRLYPELTEGQLLRLLGRSAGDSKEGYLPGMVHDGYAAGRILLISGKGIVHEHLFFFRYVDDVIGIQGVTDT